LDRIGGANGDLVAVVPELDSGVIDERFAANCDIAQ
jgi:hypothetical protein